MKRIGLSLAGALLATVVGGGTASGAGDLPAPTGSNAVGRRVVRLIDQGRSEVLSPKPGDRREVTVYLWYPAAERPTKSAPYVYSESLVRALSRDEASLARRTVTHAGENSVMADAPSRFPLVLLSPGNGSTVALYTGLGEELASHGYVVAAVDHPYDSNAVLLTDGRVAKQAKQPDGGEALLQYQRERVTVRVADLRFLADQLTKSDDALRFLNGRLDLSHIGALGHSVGGMTAAEFCMRDPRASACANLDGVVAAMPVYTDASGSGPSQPFLFMDKPFSAVRGETPDETARRTSFLRQRGNVALANVKQGHSYRVTLTGASHATFSDEEVVTIGTQAQHLLFDRVRTYVRAFFDEALKGEAVPALAAPTVSAPVQVDVFLPK